MYHPASISNLHGFQNTGKEKTSEESLNPREVYQHYTKQGKSVIPAHASTNTEREKSRNASVEGY